MMETITIFDDVFVPWERVFLAGEVPLAGRLAHDGSPDSFLEWAIREEPALQTPGARMFALAGLAPPPIGV